MSEMSKSFQAKDSNQMGDKNKLKRKNISRIHPGRVGDAVRINRTGFPPLREDGREAPFRLVYNDDVN